MLVGQMLKPQLICGMKPPFDILRELRSSAQLLLRFQEVFCRCHESEVKWCTIEIILKLSMEAGMPQTKSMANLRAPRHGRKPQVFVRISCPVGRGPTGYHQGLGCCYRQISSSRRSCSLCVADGSRHRSRNGP